MAPSEWVCPFTPCIHPTKVRNYHKTLYHEHYLRNHTSQTNPALTLKQHREISRVVSEAMERAQRNRVPTAKAAENIAAAGPSQPHIDLTKLTIVTPEWKGLPTDAAFFEEPREITKIDPIKKISSTTGEEIELFRLGPHLESQNKFHYTRAKGDHSTGYFHNAYAPPDYARFSDEDHPLCSANNDPKLDVRFSKDMLTAYHSGPNRTFKANVCAREGTFFYEAKVLSCFEANMDTKLRMALTTALSEGKSLKGTRIGCPRIGFARREAWSGYDVGATGYGYGVTCYGSSNPNFVTCGGKMRELDAMPVIKENDVIGLMITLPSLEDHRRIVEAKTPEEQVPKAKSSTVTHIEGASAEPEEVAQGGAGEGSGTTKSKKSKKGKKKNKGKGKGPAATASTNDISLEIPTEPYPTIKDYDPAKPIDDPPHNIVHERFPIRAKGHTYFESSEYLVRPEFKASAAAFINDEKDIKRIAMGRPIPRQPLKWFDPPAFHDWPTMRGLPNSKIEIWVNGKYCGKVVENLFAFLPPASTIDVQKEKVLPPNMQSGEWDDGTLGYYPAVSIYGGGIVQFRFHDFWYGHDGRPGVRSFEDRYWEQKVSDGLDDVIDEAGWAAEHEAAGGPSIAATSSITDDWVKSQLPKEPLTQAIEQDVQMADA